MEMALLWLILFSQLTFAECPAGNPMEPSQMTPEGIKAWLAGRRDSVKTVGDAICCLPPKFLKGYFVAHASIAGQNGSPESPRVILNDGPVQFSTDRDVMLLSANGGAEYLSQNDNLEMMFFRRSTERLELFDGSREGGKFVMSAKNPPLCMSCHGDGSQEEPKHGPHPNFDPFGNWPRFVGGGLKCFKEEDRVQIHQQKLALESVRDNPRFRCLDKSQLDDDIKNLTLAEETFKNNVKSVGVFEGFDSFLFEINNMRVVRIVKDTPDFNYYKYVIVAEQICDVDAEIEKWIPPAVLKNHNQMKTVSAEYVRVENTRQMRALIEDAKAKAKVYRDNFKANFEKTIADRKSGLDPTSLPFVCDKPSDTETDIGILPNIVSMVKNPVLRAYKIDAAFKRRPLEIRGATSGTQRFLFEARGIDMGHWGMEPSPNEYKIKNEIAEQILRQEPAGTRLKGLFEERNRRTEKASKTVRYSPDIEKWFCNSLRNASFEELSRLGSRKLPSEEIKTTR